MQYNTNIPYQIFFRQANGNINLKGSPQITGVLNVYKDDNPYLIEVENKIKNLTNINYPIKQDYTPEKMKLNGEKLWYHQNKNVELLLYKKTHLLEDEMRTGKTLAVISAIYWDKKLNHNWKKVLITPGSKTLMYKWKEDILNNTDLEVSLLEGDKKRKFKEFLTAEKDLILIASKDTIKSFFNQKNKSLDEAHRVITMFKDLKDANLDLWVIDESHFLGNRKSQQTKTFLKIRNFINNVILMTGTPVNESMTNYFAAINFLYPEVSYWTLLGLFFDINRIRIGYNRFVNEYGFSEMCRDKFNLLRFFVASKIELRKINKNIKEYKEHNLNVPLTETQLEYQKELLEFFQITQKDLNPLKKHQLALNEHKFDLRIKTPIEAITRLEQLTLDPRLFEKDFTFFNQKPGAKTIQILRIIFKNRTKKILIFSRLKSYLDLLYKDILRLNEELKENVTVNFLVGSMTNTNKNKIISDFQDNKIDVLLIQNRVGATGLTLHNADITIIPSLSWNYNEKDQIKERMRNIDKSGMKHYIYLSSNGIYDNLVEEKIIRKRENGKYVASEEQLKELMKAFKWTYGYDSGALNEIKIKKERKWK